MRHLAAAAAVALSAFAVACSGCGGGGSDPSAGTSAPRAVTAPAEPPPGAAPVARGAALRALDGESLEVALLQVRDPALPSAGGPPPAVGRRYVAVELRISNAGERPYQDTPANGAGLRDTAGGEWIASLGDPVAPGLGTLDLAPGESRTGWLTFEVPAGVVLATLRFTADGGFGGAAAWRLR